MYMYYVCVCMCVYMYYVCVCVFIRTGSHACCHLLPACRLNPQPAGTQHCRTTTVGRRRKRRRREMRQTREGSPVIKVSFMYECVVPLSGLCMYTPVRPHAPPSSSKFDLLAGSTAAGPRVYECEGGGYQVDPTTVSSSPIKLAKYRYTCDVTIALFIVFWSCFVTRFHSYTQVISSHHRPGARREVWFLQPV